MLGSREGWLIDYCKKYAFRYSAPSFLEQAVPEISKRCPVLQEQAVQEATEKRKARSEPDCKIVRMHYPHDFQLDQGAHNLRPIEDCRATRPEEKGVHVFLFRVISPLAAPEAPSLRLDRILRVVMTAPMPNAKRRARAEGAAGGGCGSG